MALELLSVRTRVLVFQLQHEKAELEQHLEQEQEFQVNKLMKKIKKLENDTISKQLTLEQVSPGSLPAFSHLGGGHGAVGGRDSFQLISLSIPLHVSSRFMAEMSGSFAVKQRGKVLRPGWFPCQPSGRLVGTKSHGQESFRRNDGHLPTFLAL